MSSVGSCLRELRLKRGISLDEIASETRVTLRYLAALEADDFSILPPGVFTRGFIRAYCQTIGESPEQALALYDQAQRGPVLSRRAGAVGPVEIEAGPGQGRGRSAVFVSFVLLVSLGIALVAVTLALQGGREPITERRSDQPAGSPATAVVTDARPMPPPAPPESWRAAAPSSRGTVTSPRPSPPVASVPAPDTAVPSLTPRSGPGPAATPPATAALVPHPPSSVTAPPPLAVPPSAPAVPLPAVRRGEPYRLVARTTELTWLRIQTVDGHLTEENVPAGQVREWVSNRPFKITVGNAGGVTFELNGQPLPRLGGSGVVVRELFLPLRESPHENP